MKLGLGTNLLLYSDREEILWRKTGGESSEGADWTIPVLAVEEAHEIPLLEKAQTIIGSNGVTRKMK